MIAINRSKSVIKRSLSTYSAVKTKKQDIAPIIIIPANIFSKIVFLFIIFCFCYNKYFLDKVNASESIKKTDLPI